MIKFTNERVVSFSLDYQDVLWEILPTSEDLQDYQFFVERSEASAGPWIIIAGPLVDQYRIRDNDVPLISTNARTLHYRIRAVHLPSNKEVISRVFDREGESTLLAKEMVRLENLLFQEFVGVKA